MSIPQRFWIPSFLILAANASAQQVVKLSDPMPAVVGGDVEGPQLSPDARWIVYVADRDLSGVTALYSVPADGSAPAMKLNPDLTYGGFISDDFQFTPDSARVVYRARVGGGPFELFSVPIDASAAAVRISAALQSNRNVFGFLVTPDGARVLYRADQMIDEKFELFSVPVDGSETSVRISGTIILQGDVLTDFTTTPDGQTVVFRADADTDGALRIYTVPVAGGPRVQLDETSGTLRTLEYELSPDGLTVVYTANQDNPNRTFAYSVPVAGGPSIRISGTGVSIQLGLCVAPDSSRALFHGGNILNVERVLLSAPLDGSTPVVNLSGPMMAGGTVRPGFKISPCSRRAVYVADQLVDEQLELFSVPMDGSAPPVRLNAPLPAFADVSQGFGFAHVAGRVVFLADATTDGLLELFSVPLLGTALPTRLDRAAGPAGRVTGFELQPRGERVVYQANQDDPGTFELFSAPALGDAEPVKLNATPVAGGGYSSFFDRDFAISPERGPRTRRMPGGERRPGARVFYALDQETDGVTELYSTRIDGGDTPLKLSLPFLANDIRGDVEQARTAGDRVVYRADQEVDERVELYSVPLDRSSPPVALQGTLVAAGDVTSFQISPDVSRVVYLADQDADEVVELYSAPIDGGAAAVKLGPVPVAGGDVDLYRIDPLSQRAVFCGDLELDGVFELYSAPLDGSAAAVKLNPPLIAGADVGLSTLISSDGARAVFTTQGPLGIDLYTIPVDGSSAAFRLNTVAGSVGLGSFFSAAFVLSPDGSRVVYRAREATNEELYSVPIDGSAAAVRVNDPFVAGGGLANGFLTGFTFLVTPDGQDVVYVASQDTPGRNELYLAPIDGSGGSVRLSAPLIAGGNVNGLRLGTTHALYLADGMVDERFELFSVPLDLSSGAAVISGTLIPTTDVQFDFKLTPDGNTVLFRADNVMSGRLVLFSVPVAGGTRVRLDAGLGQNDGVTDFLLGPGANEALFRIRTASLQELFRVPTDGSAVAQRVHTPLAFLGSVDGYVPADDGLSVVYHAGQDVPQVSELYSSQP